MLKSISSRAFVFPFLFIGVVLSSALAAGQALTVTTFAGNGTAGYVGDGFQATIASLNFPECVAVDAAGDLYISDWFNNVVREVTVNGIIQTVVGSNAQGYAGDGGPATAAEISFPFGLTFDQAGNLYIADSANNVIRIVNPAGNISTFAGNNTLGYSGDGGPATSAQLYGPYGIVMDAHGNLYISDSGNQVIREVLAGGEMVTFGGNHYPGYSGDGGHVSGAQFNYPKGMAIDAAGNIYVADYGNSVVRKITTNGFVSTVAGTGIPGYSGDGGPAVSAQLNYPQSVAVDTAGNLYISDTENQVIRRVSATDGSIATVAGNGIRGYTGDGGPGTSAEFFFPKGLAAGSAGSIYVADWDNSVIRLLSPAASAHDREPRIASR